jgi:hypothetical protein
LYISRPSYWETAVCGIALYIVLMQGMEIHDVLDRVVKGEYEMPRRISRSARALVRVMLESVYLQTATLTDLGSWTADFDV